jgi:hypothetical protein
VEKNKAYFLFLFSPKVTGIKTAIRDIQQNLLDMERLHRDSLVTVTGEQAAMKSKQLVELGEKTDDMLKSCQFRIRSKKCAPLTGI